MKKLKSLVALTICLLTLFSCQKPEGTLPGSWMFSSGNGLIQCSVTGNLDYAIYVFNANLQSAGVEQLQIDKVELHYVLDDQGQNEKTVTILSDTVLKSNFRTHDTIWGLTPDKAYRYSLTIADFFNEEHSDTLSFHTIPVGNPIVTLDTAFLRDGLVRCYGTLKYHWRTPVPVDSIAPRSLSDGFSNAISEKKVVETQKEGDMIIDQFCFSHDLGNEVACQYMVRATNTWGKSAISDTLSFSLFDIWVLTERVSALGAHSLLAYGRPMKDGEGVTLNKLGFCVADHYNVGLNDEVYDVNPGSMVWGSSYQLRISGLEPGTQYFVKAYMRINGENGPLYYGVELPVTTWEEVPVYFEEPDESMITESSAFLRAIVGTLGSQVIDEYGFIWKEVDSNDPLNDEVSFAEGQYDGYFVCDNIDELQQFSGTVEGLMSQTKFWFKAYVKFKINGEYSYSESHRVDTKR